MISENTGNKVVNYTELHLFKLFGVPVYARLSSLVLVYILVSGIGTLAAFGLLACILAHEFAHILVARQYGYSTSRVDILFLGMAASINVPQNQSVRGEAMISFAGPLINFVLATAILAPLVLLGFTSEDLAANQWLNALSWIGIGNLVLGIFNLLPMYPMDGGRIVRGISVWFGASHITATKIGAWLCTAVGATVFGYAIQNDNVLMGLIACIMPIAAWFEVKMIQQGHDTNSFS